MLLVASTVEHGSFQLATGLTRVRLMTLLTVWLPSIGTPCTSCQGKVLTQSRLSQAAPLGLSFAGHYIWQTAKLRTRPGGVWLGTETAESSKAKSVLLCDRMSSSTGTLFPVAGPWHCQCARAPQSREVQDAAAYSTFTSHSHDMP